MSYFSLKNDGDEAIVRILHDTTDSFDIFACHQAKYNGKDRYVNCLRDPHDPVEKCPFCEAGEKLSYQFYIHLIEYVTGENGQIIPTAKIWQRGMSYANTIKNLISEYGNLSDVVFKIKRSGAAGSRDTTYSIMMANPNVYRSDLYPKVDLFGDYQVLGAAVLNKSFEDMNTYINTGAFPTPNAQATPKEEVIDTTEEIDTSYKGVGYNKVPTSPRETTYSNPPTAVPTRETPPWETGRNVSVTAPNRRY